MTARRPVGSKFEMELDRFATLNRQQRMIALTVVAHELTVGIRSALAELPSREAAERAKVLNEYLHQITGRICSSGSQSANEEYELLKDIAEDASHRGLGGLLERRLGAALRHATTGEHSRVTA
jgi:hypothetical protein